MNAKDDEIGRQRQLQDQQTSLCEALTLGSLISTNSSQSVQPCHSSGGLSQEHLIAIISSVLAMMQDFLTCERPDDSRS